jgi:hypothetical protein
VDGRRVLACLTLAVTCEGHQVTTIQGLSDGSGLHPMQASFIERDAFQCGYCTLGRIMSAVALPEEGHAGDNAEIAEWISGNIASRALTLDLTALVALGLDRALASYADGAQWTRPPRTSGSPPPRSATPEPASSCT